MANEGITWVVLALAILSILLVVRHTRAEEESGRSEMVRAAVVGRHAPVVAAVTTLAVVNAVIALLSALAMTGVCEGELDLTNALAMTLGSGLSALVFGGVAVVMCQLTEHGRAATGASLAVFAVAFVVRAVGDMQEREETRCPGSPPSPGHSRCVPSLTCGGGLDEVAGEPGVGDQHHRQRPAGRRRVTAAATFSANSTSWRLRHSGGLSP